MANAVESLTNANLDATGLATQAGSLIFMLFMIAAVVGVFLFLLFYAKRFLSYNVDIEFWEKKGEDLVYFGDDKAKRVNKKGVSYISFLKNKGDLFSAHQFPNSDYVYKKRMFGSKIKYVINGDELVPTQLGLSKSLNLVAEAMPSYQKIDYIQRLQKYEEEYKNKGNRAQTIMFVLGASVVIAVFFAFFVIWQSNVATAEATKALANAVASASQAPTLPTAPG